MNEPIRVAMIDEDAVFRAGVVEKLRSDRRLEIVAEGGTLAVAYRVVEEFRPTLLLLDIQLIESSDATAVSEIKRLSPATQVVVLGGSDSKSEIVSAFRAGARGYVIKGAAASGQILSVIARLTPYLELRENSLCIQLQ